MNTIKKRVEFLDIIRGGAVILVIFGHSGIPDTMNEIIKAFHMPIFFILSGCVIALSDNSQVSWKAFLLKKTRQLILPYFLFEAINLLISLIVHPFAGNYIYLPKALKSIFLCINDPVNYNGICLRLWFLPCIFFSQIFVKVYMELIKILFNRIKPFILHINSFIFFIIVSFTEKFFMEERLPFTLDISLMGAAYISIGCMIYPLCKYFYENKNSIVRNVLIKLVLIIAFAVAFHENGTINMFINQYGNIGISLIEAISGSLLFGIAMMHIKSSQKFFSWLSKNSLIIFPIHLEILCFLNQIFDRANFFAGEFDWIIKAPLVILILFPATYIFKKVIPKNYSRFKER